ncbi:MAG TPA: Asd/ArgC dimerization domain-containing protein [Candidatus Polarisedimenticolaceae bacterium]|nr:Asd/ArgC dimerization domain-containing protein [Candidatus Polarisedimenticolaceae bacterium]
MARAETRERIAVLGATSPAGGYLRAALAERGIPGERIELYGHGRDVAVLSEYDGEARLVQPAGDLDASGFAALFVCEEGHDANALTAAAGKGSLVVDLSGSIAAPAVPIPHPLTLLLEPLMTALHRRFELTRAGLFVLRPASDFGAPGLEELREQTVHLLRFESAPAEVFGRQLAFSVIPAHLFPAAERGAADRVAAEFRALLQAPDLDLTVSLALVPTFLGHAIAIHAALRSGDAPAVAEALAAVKTITVATDPETGSTLDAPEEAGLVVARIDDAGAGRVRLWVLGSEPGALAAERAMAAASEAGVLVNAS